MVKICNRLRLENLYIWSINSKPTNTIPFQCKKLAQHYINKKYFFLPNNFLLLPLNDRAIETKLNIPIKQNNNKKIDHSD